MYRMKMIIIACMLIVFTACGYKPSSVIIKKLFDDEVYVEVHVDRVEPENAPFVKDEMNRLIYIRFNGRVSEDKNASSRIYVNYRGSRFRGIAYDDRGFVTRYRADIYVNFEMYTKKGKIKKRISARHEADIQASSLASSTLRTEAIRRGLEKALDEFLAYVTVKGLLKSNKKKKKNIKVEKVKN